MKTYRLMKSQAEFNFASQKSRNHVENELKLGCTYERCSTPELVAEFRTIEEGRNELLKYKCTVSEDQHYGKSKSYEVEEYYLVEVTLNEDLEEISWDYLNYATDEISLKYYRVDSEIDFGDRDDLLELVNIVLSENIHARTEAQACEIAMKEISCVVDETDDYYSELHFDEVRVFNLDNEQIGVCKRFTANLLKE